MMEVVFEIFFEIIEFIFDIITDIIFEGTVKNMKIPMILRIIAIFLVLLVYLGFSGFILYIGYSAFYAKDYLMALIFGTIGILILIGGLYETRKSLKNKNAIENREE